MSALLSLRFIALEVINYDASYALRLAKIAGLLHMGNYDLAEEMHCNDYMLRV